MKPTTPHDPFDDLLAGALLGELTPEERAALEARLQNDPAARAADQETQLMNDLLERTHREARPGAHFEERMLAGVRRKIRNEGHDRETPWESVVFLWRGLKRMLGRKSLYAGGALSLLVLLLVGIFKPAVTGSLQTGQPAPWMGQMKESFAKTYLPAAVGLKKIEEHRMASATFALPVGSAQTIQPMPGGATDSAPRSAATLADANSDAPVEAKLVARMAPELATATAAVPSAPAPAPALAAASTDTRKLVRNAQLDLRVKSYQAAVDQITSLTKEAGGYVDTSHSQRGGNGKLQGSVVVKILPENLDGFLLKLRGLGEVQNQAVSTEDVTKEYYDTQARLGNSRRMETQLQELLKHDNGKVEELLQVERELGRVRGEIEQMQGELKLYDFQVQYATVTISVQEENLDRAAAYLLMEDDQFTLFATDVEKAFQEARQVANDLRANILTANLMHHSGSDVSATMTFDVPPEQIDGFLARVRMLGRVQEFTRQTQRVARDGGNTDQPADETRTEKDGVKVQLTIQADNQSQKQVAMTIVTPGVEEALDRAKAAALALPGAEILASSLNKTPEGQSTGQINLRVPGRSYPAMLKAFGELGRTSSFSLQRDDHSGPNTTDDDTPVTISLSLTDDEAPLQETQLTVLSNEVDAKAQQLKKDAAGAGVEVKVSSFAREPDGTETAQITFKLPLARYADFVEKLKRLGQVELLTIHREDRPDQGRTDENAPAEIDFRLHSEGPLVSNEDGFTATLRRTFGEGAQALLASVRMIGVLLAFILPWVILGVVVAWGGRRIYLARRRK